MFGTTDATESTDVWDHGCHRDHGVTNHGGHGYFGLRITDVADVKNHGSHKDHGYKETRDGPEIMDLQRDSTAL